ncbi:MAG: hypothetical protein ACOY5V_04775 [Pseudomonadota bacterium]
MLSVDPIAELGDTPPASGRESPSPEPSNNGGDNHAPRPRRNTGLKLIAATLLDGGFAHGGAALADKRDDTIRFAYDQAPKSVDPFFNDVHIGVIIGATVRDTLIYRDPNTNEHKGLPDWSWRQIDDRTIDFDLRECVPTTVKRSAPTRSSTGRPSSPIRPTRSRRWRT